MNTLTVSLTAQDVTALFDPTRCALSLPSWGFRTRPDCRAGDRIEFVDVEGVVAAATVWLVKAPEGRVTYWRVQWLPHTFEDLRGSAGVRQGKLFG